MTAVTASVEFGWSTGHCGNISTCLKHCIWTSNSAQLVLSKMVAFLTKVAVFESQVMFGIPELLADPVPILGIKREKFEHHLVSTGNDLLF